MASTRAGLGGTSISDSVHNPVAYNPLRRQPGDCHGRRPLPHLALQAGSGRHHPVDGTRRKANYALELFRRERSLAGQVVQCVDGAFCRPPPDWVVRGATLAGPREFTAEYFIDWTPSIRPSRKLAQGMEKLEQYAENHPDDVVRRPPGTDH